MITLNTYKESLITELFDKPVKWKYEGETSYSDIPELKGWKRSCL